MDKVNSTQKQLMTLEDRRVFTMTGVKEVESSNDNLVVIKSNMGKLIIKGKNFSIGMLNVETGQFNMTGEVCKIDFKGNNDSGKSFMLR